MTPKEAKGLVALADIIESTVKDMTSDGPGAPSEVIWNGLWPLGVSLATYQSTIQFLKDRGIIREETDVLYHVGAEAARS